MAAPLLPLLKVQSNVDLVERGTKTMAFIKWGRTDFKELEVVFAHT
jgi:hypothetical protein